MIIFKLKIFSFEYPYCDPQGKQYPKEHDTGGEEDAGAVPKEILLQRTRIAHQCTDIHFQHDENPAKVDWVQSR